jgi:hypothetical protein
MKSKKFSVALVAMLFIVTSAGAILHADDGKSDHLDQFEVLNEKISFSRPQLIRDQEFTSIEIDNVKSSTIGSIDKPLLPVKKMVYEFPMGTIINGVTISHSEIETETVEQPLKPTPAPQPYTITPRMEKEELYNNFIFSGYDYSGYYPDSWFDYSIGVGLNKDNEQTIFVTVNTYPVRYSHEKDTVKYVSTIDVDVSYDDSNAIGSLESTYDFLIISASAYLDELDRLVDHKENRGIRTNLVNVDDIDNQGRDLAEKIKLFIMDSYEETGVQYVMLVGGHRGFFGFNRPDLQIPTRYVHLDCGGEPGYVSDLYYADFYRYNEDTSEYEFSSWDTNNNDKFGEWYGRDGFKIDEMDLKPDINFGRLACRRPSEAKTMVDKIIQYENNDNKDWFEKMYVISGDDFQDQPMLDIQWDTAGLQGEFTIYAESTNDKMETGPQNVVTVTVDHSQESVVSFSEEDHLTTGLNYPHPPVAEITSPSEGNILGDTDVNITYPPGAYIGERWTPIIYEDKIMHIRGKSYNPQNQITEGANTTITVWIEDETGETIFGPVERESNVYFEGEWANQKALDYMPESFEKIKLWSSIGTLHGTDTNPNWGVDMVLDHLSTGAGFVFIAGHASPMVWADHYPGIPGGRHNGDIVGLMTMDIGRSGAPLPSFPLNDWTNAEKLPIMILSGCSPVKIDVSLMNLLTGGIYAFFYGTATFESLGWWMTRLEGGGTIATVGPSSLAYGYIGQYGTEGLGGWIWPEFFRQYSIEGETILGEAFTQTLNSYINEFGPDLDIIETKSVQQQILLGDPTLQMG